MDEVDWVRQSGWPEIWEEHLGGVVWADAPLPSRWHRCKPQTRAKLRHIYVERCACGATRFESTGGWTGKNERRTGRAVS